MNLNSNLFRYEELNVGIQKERKAVIAGLSITASYLFRSRFPTSELPGQVRGVIPFTKVEFILMSSEVLSLSAPPAYFLYLRYYQSVNRSFSYVTFLCYFFIDKHSFFYLLFYKIFRRVRKWQKNHTSHSIIILFIIFLALSLSADLIEYNNTVIIRPWKFFPRLFF